MTAARCVALGLVKCTTPDCHVWTLPRIAASWPGGVCDVACRARGLDRAQNLRLLTGKHP